MPIIDHRDGNVDGQSPSLHRKEGGKRLVVVVALLVVSALVVSAYASVMRGDPVGSEFLVNTVVEGDQITPSVAINDTGVSIVVWSSWKSDWNGYGVYAQILDSLGSKVGSAYLVANYTDDQRNPSVSTWYGDGFMIVWQTTRDYQPGSGTYNNGIRYVHFIPQVIYIETLFPYEDNPDDYDPAGASSPSGDWIVVMTQWDQGNSSEEIRGMGSNLGLPSGNINTFTSGSQNSPSVAMDSDGDFVVVWRSEDQDGDAGGIYGQRYLSNASKIGAEFAVNTYTDGDQSQPSVAMDSAGNFVVVWASWGQDDSSWDIYGQRFSSDGMRIGLEFRVNTYPTGDQYQPSVDMSAGGDFVVCWCSVGQDESGAAIVGQRYLSDGTPLGSEFLVNSYTTDNQMRPCVSLNGMGDFMVVWQSENQDGSGWGIYGQLYNRAPIPEFSAVVVPVALTIVGLMAIRSSRRRRARL